MNAYSVASANEFSHIDRHHFARGHAASRWDHVGVLWCGYLVDEVVHERVVVVLERGELGVDLVRGHGRGVILMGGRWCERERFRGSRGERAVIWRKFAELERHGTGLAGRFQANFG